MPKQLQLNANVNRKNLICNRLRVILLNVHGWPASKPSYKLAEISQPLRVLRRPIPANAPFARRPMSERVVADSETGPKPRWEV